MTMPHPRREVVEIKDDEHVYRQAMQALPSQIIVIDRAGTITMVNHAWLQFARANGGCESAVTVGVNYLDICQALGEGAAQQGIASVLCGSQPSFSMEYPCHSPSEHRWFRMTVCPLSTDGRAGAVISGAVISHENITGQKQAEATVRASAERFRTVFESSGVGLAEIGLDGRLLRANSQICRITGYSAEALMTMHFDDLTLPDDCDADLPHKEIMRTGVIDSYSLEKRYVRRDKSVRWVNVTISCVRSPDRTIQHYVAVVEDIAKRKDAEERQRLLMRELSHRGMNLLAVVQSIAGRTITGTRTLAEARSVFIGRLQALSRTFSMLTNEAFEGAPLDDIVKRELASFAGRATMDGPDVMLAPKIAQTFALVVHELATNAAKYGSLSAAAGEVQVSWTITDGSADDQARSVIGPPKQFKFEWRESGGPAAVPPTRRGFGTTLVSQVAGSEFGCTPELIYGDHGLHYRFDAPLDNLGAVSVDTPLGARIKSDVIKSLYDLWVRQRGTENMLPRLSEFEWARFSASGALTIAAITPDHNIDFVQLGRGLVERYGRHIEDGAIEDTAALTPIYQRCGQTKDPCHEMLRFDFGDGDPMTFERLLVPFSSSDGCLVTHVVGLAVFRGETKQQ
jgi:PAS domain S-box-containing protein